LDFEGRFLIILIDYLKMAVLSSAFDLFTSFEVERKFLKIIKKTEQSHIFGKVHVTARKSRTRKLQECGRRLSPDRLYTSMYPPV
jgi:uncharacterized protein YbaP (TraB family)